MKRYLLFFFVISHACWSSLDNSVHEEERIQEFFYRGKAVSQTTFMYDPMRREALKVLLINSKNKLPKPDLQEILYAWGVPLNNPCLTEKDHVFINKQFKNVLDNLYCFDDEVYKKYLDSELSQARLLSYTWIMNQIIAARAKTTGIYFQEYINNSSYIANLEDEFINFFYCSDNLLADVKFINGSMFFYFFIWDEISSRSFEYFYEVSSIFEEAWRQRESLWSEISKRINFLKKSLQKKKCYKVL